MFGHVSFHKLSLTVLNNTEGVYPSDNQTLVITLSSFHSTGRSSRSLNCPTDIKTHSLGTGLVSIPVMQKQHLINPQISGEK
jgi:hypothetical protein